MSVLAYVPYGAEGIIIRVEADIRRGIPGIDITGLAEGAVREARERVRAAFRNSGFTFPTDRILINLAPAGMRKDGAALDLPIAISVMAAAGFVPVTSEIMVMGELELSGIIRPVRGVLAAISAGMQAGINEFIVPAGNAGEAAILNARCAAVGELKEAVYALFSRGKDGGLKPTPNRLLSEAPSQDKASFQTNAFPQTNTLSLASASNSAVNRVSHTAGDFADVRGQEICKRALEVAAAGGHNVLIFGPPGAGKTMLASRLPSIMAPLTPDEAVEVTRLYSLAGPSRAGNPESIEKNSIINRSGFIDRLITHPPFRAPHHSASAEGILGGGRIPHPGEISLAHYGVLFLDEAPEFRANVLQALREPLENRVISIVRAEGPVHLPAEFQLILAANACPCGRLGMRNIDPSVPDYTCTHSCFCSTDEIYRYWRKFGGALLDRIEIRVAVVPPSISKMDSGISGGPNEEKSAHIAQRVLAAVEIQRKRFKGTGIRRNALIPASLIEKSCPLSTPAKSAFQTALSRLGFSGRAYHGILRVARTIADLEGCVVIDTRHILEAVQHRRLGDDPFEVLNAE